MPDWDASKGLMSIEERINSVFDEVFSDKWDYNGVSYGVWSPPVDIYETDTSIVMRAELPGMSENDFEVDIHTDLIVIKGERHFKKNLREEHYHRIERPYGTFRRIFNLPGSVDKENVKASYESGVIEIIMPKLCVDNPERIKIRIEDDD